MSTLAAPLKNGHPFVGCELNAEYIRMAEKRTAQRPLNLEEVQP